MGLTYFNIVILMSSSQKRRQLEEAAQTSVNKTDR